MHLIEHEVKLPTWSRISLPALMSPKVAKSLAINGDNIQRRPDVVRIRKADVAESASFGRVEMAVTKRH